MFQKLTKERVQEGDIQIAMVQERNFGGWFGFFEYHAMVSDFLLLMLSGA